MELAEAWVAAPCILFPVGDPTCSDCEELSCPGNMLDFTLLTSGYFGTHPPKPRGTRWESSLEEETVTSFAFNRGPRWRLLGRGCGNRNRMGG